MSADNLEDLNDHLRGIRQIVQQQRIILEENGRLKAENKELREQISQSKSVLDRNCELEAQLEGARRTKKTFQRIEELEQSVLTLTQELGQLRLERASSLKVAESAQYFVERLDYIAAKLRVKPGNRTPKELLSAIEDAVRKIV